MDALPNGPVGHPTIRVFLAGGVPEVMLHFRELNQLDLSVLTVTGTHHGNVLEWWQTSEPPPAVARLAAGNGIDPDDVIMSPTRPRNAA